MKNKFQELFNSQEENQYNIGNTSYKERIKKLKALKKAIEVTYREQIKEALYKDFKKPNIETDLTEIYPVIGEIKHAIKNLKKWIRKQRVATPIALLGSSSWIKYEPKGVCLIISPWNFPVNLTFGPLVSAIAAGNTVIIKPSEMTPNTSKVMGALIADIFNENEIALVEGEVKVSQELLKLPFNHIFFTGAPSIGKIVMKAAAENLASVTLELGGKSPTIVDKTANIKATAKKIVWGKFMNNGQVCVAPDYILVHESIKEEFVNALRNQITAFYAEDASQSDSYCRIVNAKHYNRLANALENAKSKGATIEIGGKTIEKENYIEPTVVSNLSEDTILMQEEIFGPILPIKTYSTTEEVIDYINAGDIPLALYIYSKNSKVVNQIIDNTRAGSTCINNNVMQYTNHHLPFGGANNSGIGKAHGYYGFLEFSNMRSILKQHTKSSIELLFPPYTKQKEKLAKVTVKWF